MNRIKLFNSIYEMCFDSDDILKETCFKLHIYETDKFDEVKKIFDGFQNVIIRTV